MSEEHDEGVARVAEEPQHDGGAEHLRHEEEVAPVVDQVAKPLLGADELGDDDDEERERHAEADPGEDLRKRRRQDDAEEELTTAGAQAGGGAQQERGHLLNPVDHRSQNEPGPREENRIEEVEEHDEPGREAPQEEKRENGAETQHECASPRQQRSAESPLHQVRHRAHGTSPWWTYHARGARSRQPAPEPAIIGERRTMTADSRTTVGLLHPGDMGSAVGATLLAGGARVLWASEGRSAATRGSTPPDRTRWRSRHCSAPARWRPSSSTRLRARRRP